MMSEIITEIAEIISEIPASGVTVYTIYYL